MTLDKPLKTLAEARGFIYGANINHLDNDPTFFPAFQRECAIMLISSDLRFEVIHPLQGSSPTDPAAFNFAFADTMVNVVGIPVGMKFHMQALIFRDQDLPAWVPANLTPANVQSYLEGHVTVPMQHFAGKVRAWNVVNEAIRPQDGNLDGIRTCGWYTLYSQAPISDGKRYIRDAFAAANTADPAAKLYYNEFGLDLTGSDDVAKRAATLALLDYIQAGPGCRIDALGIQAHMWPQADGQMKAGTGQLSTFDPAVLKAFIKAVAAKGLKVYITELDVRDTHLVADIPTRDAQVADVYRRYLDAALSEPNVEVVMTFGLSDLYTWYTNGVPPRSDGLPIRPLLLDTAMNKKAAYTAVAEAFSTPRNTLAAFNPTFHAPRLPRGRMRMR